MIQRLGAFTGAAQISAQHRLVRAAHEFEAQMMKELLKPLASGDGLTGNGDSDSGSTSALGAFASESLGQAISQQGGLGIARDLIRTLSHSGADTTAAAVTGKTHCDTGIRLSE